MSNGLTKSSKSILHAVIILQFIWAVMLLFPGMAKDVITVTSIYSTSVLVGFSPFFTSMLYFGVCVSSIYALRRNKYDRTNLILFIPQIIVCVLSVTGAVWATVLGSYLDGTKVPAAHIFADQLVFLGMAFLVFRAIFLPYIILINIKSL